MATISGSTAYSTPFTPVQGDFNVQVTGGRAYLQRRNATAQPFAPYATLEPGGYTIPNSVANAQYQWLPFVTGDASAAVHAEQ